MYLSRKKPDEPATIEFSEDEIEALKLDQRQRLAGPKKKRRLPAMPTIAEATQWGAGQDHGGGIGPANGPPGSSTLARPMRRLGDLVPEFGSLVNPPGVGANDDFDDRLPHAREESTTRVPRSALGRVTMGRASCLLAACWIARTWLHP
jgi:hypothetical protein